MTKLPPDIDALLASVIHQVRECAHISKVYLFGSYYSGTYTEESDLDIAFFIRDDEVLFNANRKILKITSKYPIDIQPQIFYESELQYKLGIVEEILENGRELLIDKDVQ